MRSSLRCGWIWKSERHGLNPKTVEAGAPVAVDLWNRGWFAVEHGDRGQYLSVVVEGVGK